MKQKKFSFIAALAVLLCAAAYGYNEYQRTNKDLLHAKPVIYMKAADLIQAYEKDSLAFHQNYLDKIIAVNGIVKNRDVQGNPVVFTIGQNGALSGVQCSMDSSHSDLYNTLQEGQNVKLKGICTGARKDELFGTDVILCRCVVEQVY
jgi:hypothetical protein